MAFIKTDTVFFSFAEYQDVLDADKRLFDDNEGLNVQDDVEVELEKSSTTIINKLSATLGITVDALLILDRQQDFTDLCVYHCLAKRILPKVADFGDEDNSERNKMNYYSNEFEILFNDLVSSGDWYDEDEDGTVEDGESVATIVNLRRVR